MKYGRITLEEPVEDKYRKLDEKVAPDLLDAATRKAPVVLRIINIAFLYSCFNFLCKRVVELTVGDFWLFP